MPLTFILAVSHEPVLLESRSSILRSAGYAVAQVLSIGQAIELLGSSFFDLVLLGHSIPAQDRDYLTRLIRASGLLTPVVTVAPLTDPVPYEAADLIVECSPEMLLGGVREILLKAGKNGNGSKTKTPLQTTAHYPVEEAIKLRRWSKPTDPALPSTTPTGAPNLSPPPRSRSGRPACR
jgi:CheY-like chemotaxis protein